MPPDTIVPAFTVYGGRPAQFIAELPESISNVHSEFAINYYNIFQEYKGPAAGASTASSAKPGGSTHVSSRDSVASSRASVMSSATAKQAAQEVRGQPGSSAHISDAINQQRTPA